MLKLTRYAIPIGLFAILVVFLWKSLSIDPRVLPSALINKPAPQFNLANLNPGEQNFSNNDLRGHISIINVWASWCSACRDEHTFLQALAANQELPIYGINYKDNPQRARQWLEQFGNPYDKIGVDNDGKTAINFGIYGTPETYIVDQAGQIRYRHVGAINDTVMQHEILPLLQSLAGAK